MSMVISGDNGLTFPAGSTQVQAGNYQTMVNRIINPRMEIDQRNAGASVTLTSGGIFTVDRWSGFEDTDGVMTAQQSSVAPAGFTNSLLCTATTADSSLGAAQYSLLRQGIEGFNIADLNWGTANAKTITLSFWVRSSLTGTFAGSLRNDGGARSYVFTYTISSANTWEQKSITIAGDTTGTWGTTNGAGIYLSFDLGTGSNFQTTAGSWTAGNFWSTSGATPVIGTLNATFYITGVDLRVGSYTVVPQDFRAYGTELALCQRYFEAGSLWREGTNATSANFCVFTSSFLVQKRANATFTYGNVGGANANISSIQGPEATYEWISPFDQTNVRTGFAFRFIPNNSTSTLRQYWTASAEL